MCFVFWKKCQKQVFGREKYLFCRLLNNNLHFFANHDIVRRFVASEDDSVDRIFQDFEIISKFVHINFSTDYYR